MVHQLRCLDSLPGIVLILDGSFRIRDGGWRNWRAFWQANGGSSPEPQVLDTDLTEAITEGPVRTAFRAALGAVLTGERTGLRMGFRCDSPQLQRAMRLSVTPLPGKRLLYRSELVAARPWPEPTPLLADACRCPVCARSAPEPDPARLDWLPPQRPAAAWAASDTDPCPRCHLALVAA